MDYSNTVKVIKLSEGLSLQKFNEIIGVITLKTCNSSLIVI